MPVIDASVLVAYLAGGEFADQARDALFAEPGAMWAPHLVDAETGHALRRTVIAGELTADAAHAALEDLADMPIRRVGHKGLLQRAWELRENVTFCDGLYVALAERLDMPVLTLDGRLAKAAGIRATIRALT